jgi:hypothetical protein
MLAVDRRPLSRAVLTEGVLIHVIRQKATPQQMTEMLEVLENYVKLAVDTEQGVLAGGGALHADCETALLEAGSSQKDIWGADWIPATQEVRYEALINIRPLDGNRSMELKDEDLRQKVRQTAVRLLGNQ